MNKKINSKLKQLGQPLRLNDADISKAKRTAKSIVMLAIFGGIFFLFGHLLSSGGPVGLYYGGGSVKDFSIFLRGLF